MEKSDDISNYKGVVVITGIAVLVAYVWIERTGWQIVMNNAIKIFLLITGVIILMLLLFYVIQNNAYNQKRFRISKFITTPSFFIAISMVIISFFEIDYANLDFTALLKNIGNMINNNISLIGLILFVIAVFTTAIKFIKERKEDYNLFKKKILDLTKKSHATLEQVIDSENYLKQLTYNNKGFAKKSKEIICQANKKLKEKSLSIIARDSELNKIEKERRIRKEKDNDRIEKLFLYFKEKSSSESIPKWAIPFDRDIINGAQEKFSDSKKEEYEKEREIETIKELEEEANRYILEHKALPANYHEFSWKEKLVYDEAIDKFEKGKLEPKVEIEPEDEEMAKNNFFLSTELSVKQKERFIKKYGYRNYSFSHLNGKLGNNLIIKNNSKTESDYHFCMKHLIARIDEMDSFIEYSIKDMRADVAFILGDKKIAVEIEKGTNNEKQIKKKVDWLNTHFDYWIITAPKKEQKNYRKYVDRKKSFCLGSKKTEEKIAELKEQLQE